MRIAMLIRPHTEFEFDESTYLWRYLDLHKFMSFLETKSLYFSRLDKMGDPLEGRTYDVAVQESVINGTPEESKWNPDIDESWKQEALNSLPHRKKFVRDQIEIVQKTHFASCWHINSKESIAMWKLYSNEGSIALRFNPTDLTKTITEIANSIESSNADMLFGPVIYLKLFPFNDLVKMSNIQCPAFVKDISYTHENEFRYLIRNKPLESYLDHLVLPFKDLQSLNFRVFSNPFMKQFEIENIIRLLEFYGLSNKYEKSWLKV